MSDMDQNEQTQVAHGLNEELTIILNSISIAAGLLDPGHPAFDAIMDLKRSATRATQLSRRLTRQVWRRLVPPILLSD
jgi:hypothetical protein